MRRLLPLLLVLPALVACGGGSHSSAAPASSPGSSPPSAGAAARPFVPHHARATMASWHLPTASGRQALVAPGGRSVVLAGGLVAGERSTGSAIRIDLPRGRVTPLPSLAVPVHDVAGGLLGGHPALVGGGNATEQDVVQVLRAGAWHVVGRLPTTRSDLSVVQRATGPLVIGGYDGSGTPTALLALRPDGSSRAVGTLATGVRYAATAVSGHTAYVFGGEVLGREQDTVQAVDLRTGRTRVAARLPVPLGHAMAATVGTRILLMGGRVTPDRQTDAMWWFDPASGHFGRAGRLPHPLSDAAVTSRGHRVWLLGGEDPSPSDGVLTIRVS